MRRWITAAISLAVSAALYAQDGSQPLTVWIVRPMTAADRVIERAQKDLQDITVYRESTAGDFGTPSSNVGQTAGSYGKAASDVGTNASNVGQTAGSYGQTASSLASNVPSQTAGSYGQTAGSFGTNASDFKGPPRPEDVSDSTLSRRSKGGQWRSFLSELHEYLPRLQVHFVEVNATDLRARLASPGPLGGPPDVLLSDRMPDWWPQAAPGSTVVLVGMSAGKGSRPQTVYRDAYALVRAPHPAAAREFLEWWFGQDISEKPAFDLQAASLRAQEAATVALGAVSMALDGGPLASVADKQMAEFSTQIARNEALGPDYGRAGELHFRTDVLFAEANDRFAVVAVRVHCTSPSAAGDLFPLVLLRADGRGAWKVLHLELDAHFGDPSGSGVDTIAEAQAGPSAAVGKPVLAAPLDGDQRAERSGLDLAWDNDTNAPLLVVEWQAVAHGPTEPSHLLFVRDTEGRQRTQVPAPFIDVAGPVRWRVWAMGPGGATEITGWRTVVMVP